MDINKVDYDNLMFSPFMHDVLLLQPVSAATKITVNNI